MICFLSDIVETALTKLVSWCRVGVSAAQNMHRTQIVSAVVVGLCRQAPWIVVQSRAPAHHQPKGL